MTTTRARVASVAEAIAYHHALRVSGRDRRRETEKALAPEAVRAAVTDSDGLLKSVVAHTNARERVSGCVHDVLHIWRAGVVPLDQHRFGSCLPSS